MKILLIEDNRPIALAIKRTIGDQNEIDIAGTGKLGIRRANSGKYSVIILDLNLPDKSGYEVCKELRDNGITTPLLILTGDAELRSKVTLLESGADDYLTKPFEPSELNARVNALSRRRSTQYNDSIIKIMDVTLDCIRREVTRSGIKIPLRRKEFEILQYLVENRGRAVTRAMIMNHVWEPGRESWNNTIDVHVKHLRDKLDKPFQVPLIKTAYGIGYMVDDDL